MKCDIVVVTGQPHYIAVCDGVTRCFDESGAEREVPEKYKFIAHGELPEVCLIALRSVDVQVTSPAVLPVQEQAPEVSVSTDFPPCGELPVEWTSCEAADSCAAESCDAASEQVPEPLPPVPEKPVVPEPVAEYSASKKKRRNR